jgi:Na+-transporting NADH:ubiquinone oxidoreductase subunit NqrB
MSTDANGRPAANPQAAKKGAWLNTAKPFLAPLLITCILIAGNLKYNLLEGHWGTAAAIATAILAELVFSLFASGRWPHIASAYITGISVGILLRAPLLWPYIICTLLSISSKYALRVRGRHLWNPSNLGVSVMLFLVPNAVAPLSQQWGNAIWVPLIILGLGSMILFMLGRLHITLTYIAAFVVLSFVRIGIAHRDWGVVPEILSGGTGLFSEWVSQVALLTAPSYLLFMIFMITDPKTTTRGWVRQCIVAVLVAVVETILRLNREIHAPYYALFIVAPVTNLLEIAWDWTHPRPANPITPVAAPAADGERPLSDVALGNVGDSR